jgi:uncharacterized protein YbjT (DUF2867 family)
MATTTDRPTLVLGANGKTGRRVAERLTAQGHPVRIGSRSGEPPFDWDAPDTWEPILRDVRAAYLVYYPDLAFPDAPAKIAAFSELAVRSGVRRLVLLSGRGEEEARPSEQPVRDSGAEWTVLRASWFNQNFSEDYLLEPVLDGEIALPAGDVAEPFVDAEDLADVAVAALTEDGHAGKLYKLTGPRLLTFEEAVGEIAKATGREIRFVPVSLEKFESVLAGEQVPAEFVSFLTYIFGEVLDGRNTYLTDGVRRALGREPKTSPTTRERPPQPGSGTASDERIHAGRKPMGELQTPQHRR